MFGEMVGHNYLDKLSKSGVHIRESGVLGVYDGLSIDANTLMGNDKFKLLNPEDFPAGSRERVQAQQAYDRAKPQMEAKVKALGLEGKVDITPSGISTKPGVRLGYRDSLKLMRAVDGATGASRFKLGREIKIRYTARMLGIESWLHPIEKLKGIGREEIRKKLQAAKEEKSGKLTADSAKTRDHQRSETVNEDGTITQTDTDKVTNTGNDNKIKDLSDQANSRKNGGKVKVGKGAKFKTGLKGGALAILMVGICAIIQAGDKYVENMYSLTTAMGSIYQSNYSGWGQIQSAFMGLDNKGIDMDVLAEWHTDLYDDKIPSDYDVDDEGYITEIRGYTSKSWTDAPAYQATVNRKTDASQARVPEQVATMYNENGGWGAQAMGALEDVGLGDVIKVSGSVICSEAFGWAMSALGLLALATPVGWISLAFDVASRTPAGAELLGSLINWAFQIGADVLLDDELLDPDQRSEVAYRVSEYIMQSNFASEGASKVTVAEHYENKLIAQEWLDTEWQSRPLANRLFDATDYRSTVAQVVNGAKINTVPSNIGDHFANWVKLVGAVPSFISGGLFNNRSTEARAAGTYDYGLPYRVELSGTFMDQITGDEDWDYDVNAGKVFDLLGETGTSTQYHNYTRECLGLEIGSGPEYKVTAIKSEDPNKALLVGFESGSQGGQWYKNDCANKAKQENNQRVALYAGLDYPTMASYAWYGTSSNDADAKSIAKELGFSSSGSGERRDTSGNGNIVATATGDLDQLECQDCVAFVKSVYFKAGLPQPLVGSDLSQIAPAASCGAGRTSAGATSVGGYYYCQGFSEVGGVANAVPGDVAVWSGHVGIYLGDGKVSEGGGGDRSGAASNCNINGTPWMSLDNAVFLHYDGG
jgi:hypothetical protein